MHEGDDHAGDFRDAQSPDHPLFLMQENCRLAKVHTHEHAVGNACKSKGGHVPGIG